MSTRFHRFVVVVVRFLHKAYKRTLSPLFGNACRFYPYCSDYALEAIEKHGLFKGSYLGARRLLRCHPWNPGGEDPVPPAPEWKCAENSGK